MVAALAKLFVLLDAVVVVLVVEAPVARLSWDRSRLLMPLRFMEEKDDDDE